MPSKTYSEAWAEFKAEITGFKAIYRENLERAQRGEDIRELVRQKLKRNMKRAVKELGHQYGLIGLIVMCLDLVISSLNDHYGAILTQWTVVMAVLSEVSTFVAFSSCALCFLLASRVAYENGHPFTGLTYRLLAIMTVVMLPVSLFFLYPGFQPARVFRQAFRQFWGLG